MSYIKNGMMVAILVAISWFVGCASNDPANDPKAAGTKTKNVEIPEEMSDIAKLPESEQADALAQCICPVSDKPLGSMGKPIKVSANGQDIFVCCEGCVDMVKESPDQDLAKLKKE